MNCHIWGDDWPHWDDLYKAESYISAYVYKYSFCRLMSKEKYGTIRYEYVYPPFSRKHWRIMVPYFRRHTSLGDFPYYFFYWQTSVLYNAWRWWGYKMLGRAVRKACVKFPNVVKELTDDLEWR